MASSIRGCLHAALHSLQNPYSSRRSSRLPGAAACEAFDLDFSERLSRLHRSEDDGNAYLALDWLREAMALVLFAFSSVSGLLSTLPRPCTEQETGLLQANLDDTVQLLDVCNGLKEVVSDVYQYVFLVQYAIRSADLKEISYEGKLIRVRDALLECVDFMTARDEEISSNGHERTKLETCSSLLRRMGENLGGSFVYDASRSNALFDQMYAAKVTAIFICSVLAAALSVNPRRSLAILHVSDGAGWSTSLCNLQQKVKEVVDKRKAEGSTALLEELDKLHTSVKELCALIGKVLEEKPCPQDTERVELGVLFQTLATSSEDLQRRLSLLQQQIEDLFRMLVAIRVGFLDALSQSTR